MVLIALVNLYRVGAKKIDEKELVMTVDSEDAKIVDEATGENLQGEQKS